MTDKTIEKFVKRFLKGRSFKVVDTYNEATAMLVFKRNDLKKFRVVFKDNFHDQLFNNIPEDLEVRYLKSTNPRDKQNATLGYMKKKYKIYRFLNHYKFLILHKLKIQKKILNFYLKKLVKTMTDKAIEKKVKRFLKGRPFKLVAMYDEATAIIFLKRNDLNSFHVVFKDNFHNQFSDLNDFHDYFDVRYLKSTNPRDKQNATLGYIKKKYALIHVNIKYIAS